jgi:hypothetical protein
MYGLGGRGLVCERGWAARWRRRRMCREAFMSIITLLVILF